MTTDDRVIFETLSRGLQACFEAINELAAELSEPRKKALYAKTDRIVRARAQVEAMLDGLR